MSRGAGNVGKVVLTDNNGNPLCVIAANGGLKFLGPVEHAGGAGPSGLGVVSQTIEAVLANADIIGTSAGQFGHAAGFPLIVAQGATYGVELVSAAMLSLRSVAAYTGGGNISLNVSGGGAALTGIISAANSLGAATAKYGIFRPLAAAGEILGANLGINAVAASAFTDPGTAAGTLKFRVSYRVHLLA